MMQPSNIKPMPLSIILLACVLLLFFAPLEAGCYDRREPGMDWSGCKKTNKMLDDSDFTGSRFDDANMMMSSLDKSRFKGASLVKADLSRTTARYSYFEDADLSKSVGYRAVFDHATIKNSLLTKSEYFRASFREAKISDVDWSRSELGRVDFSGRSCKMSVSIFPIYRGSCSPARNSMGSILKAPTPT